MSRWRPRANLTWAIITAVVALAGSVVGLVFDLKPEWRPDPRDKIAGAVRVIAAEPGVSLARWAKLSNPDDPGGELKVLTDSETPPPGKLRLTGVVLYVRVDLSGFKGRKVALRARVYDAHSQKPIDFGKEEDFPEGRRRKIDAPTRSSVRLLFLPPLDQLDIQKTYVRLQLNSGSDLVAVADSPTLLRGRIAAGQRAS